MKSLFLSLLALSSIAQARSGDFSPVENASLTLHNLKITSVAKEGSVLRERSFHPYTDFLVAVAVMIDPADACTKIAGQTTLLNGKLLELTAVGSRNPLVDACIAIAVGPVAANFTFEMKVLTGGFVPAARIQKQIVQFNGVGLHEVSLDLTHNTVTIKPVARRPR